MTSGKFSGYESLGTFWFLNGGWFGVPQKANCVKSTSARAVRKKFTWQGVLRHSFPLKLGFLFLEGLLPPDGISLLNGAY